MPTVTDSTIDAFAFCPDSRCKGNAVAPVRAERRVTEFSYIDRGSSLPGIESSVEHLRFADEQADAQCPHCPRTRELSATDRPVYAPLTGHRQDGLLHVKDFDPSKSNNDATVAELLKQLNELRAKVENPQSQVETEAEAERQREIAERRRAALEKARAAKAEKAR